MGEYSEQTKHAVARLSVRSLAGEPGGHQRRAAPYDGSWPQSLARRQRWTHCDPNVIQVVFTVTRRLSPCHPDPPLRGADFSKLRWSRCLSQVMRCSWSRAYCALPPFSQGICPHALARRYGLSWGVHLRAPLTHGLDVPPRPA